MARWVSVAQVEEIREGTGKELLAGDRIVAVYRVGDQFHALDGICPHAGGPLGEGCLAGPIVTCPWHGWQFDVTTGKNSLNPKITHGTFPVKVEGDQILVEIP
jgi:nitrite reductase (NADH) small subunit